MMMMIYDNEIDKVKISGDQPLLAWPSHLRSSDNGTKRSFRISDGSFQKFNLLLEQKAGNLVVDMVRSAFGGSMDPDSMHSSVSHEHHRQLD